MQWKSREIQAAEFRTKCLKPGTRARVNGVPEHLQQKDTPVRGENQTGGCGGKDTIIAEGAIPAGYYSQLRLYIGAGSNVVANGVTYCRDNYAAQEIK